MKTFFVILLISIACHSYGQRFSYPSIKLSAKDINDFIPPGWKILDSATGDLNKDRHIDAAIVLQFKDSVSLVKAEDDTVVTQPRMLIILLKDPSGNNYTLAEQNNTFILNHDQQNMDDPYVGMSIEKGILTIDFNLFMSAGGWSTSSASHKFRYQQGEFVLIGFDVITSHRASLEYKAYSYNFLAKKRSLTIGNDETSKKKTTWKALRMPKLKTLKTMEAFTWEDDYDDHYR